jgi:cytosolic carboxypeptidase protein 6
MLSCRSSLVVLAGCLIFAERLAAEPPSNPAFKVAISPGRTWTFGRDKVTFDTNFPCARLSECELRDDGTFSLLIQPENRPINHSPWFAFKVSAPEQTRITVHLRCDSGAIRYTPKISTDGVHWIALPAESFQLRSRPDARDAILHLDVGPEPLWVAAQELVSSDALESWGRTLARLPFVTRAETGRSVAGRPLYKLEIGDGGPRPGYVVVIGRQHPPEVTGSLALMRFIEEVVGGSELARSFRSEFKVLLVPLLNPDGVDRGHWRHNMAGVDLNRDWVTFAQPETRAVRDAILALREQGKIYLHLDFHSTYNDVFYTQPDPPVESSDVFTSRWLAGIQRRFPQYRVNRSASEPVRLTTSQSWAYKTLGIPAITYEIGDNTDRALLRQISAGAAQEMMALLLTAKRGDN